jgi:hypothetical protein
MEEQKRVAGGPCGPQVHLLRSAARTRDHEVGAAGAGAGRVAAAAVHNDDLVRSLCSHMPQRLGDADFLVERRNYDGDSHGQPRNRYLDSLTTV